MDTAAPLAFSHSRRVKEDSASSAASTCLNVNIKTILTARISKAPLSGRGTAQSRNVSAAPSTVVPAATGAAQQPILPSVTGARVFRSTIWGLGGQGATFVASLIATPFLTRLLGTDAYGALVLILLVPGYFAFTDMGMSVAAKRFAATAHARGRDDDEVAVIWNALAVLALPVALTATALMLTAPYLVEHALNLPQDLRASTVTGLQLAGLILVSQSALGVLNTPQAIRQRFDWISSTVAGAAALRAFLVPLVLLLGGGLTGVVAIIATISVISAAATTILSARLLPGIFRPHIQRALIVSLLHFGSAVALWWFVGLALDNTEKLLLPRLTSVDSLAYYSVAFNFAALLQILPQVLNQSLVPAFTSLQATVNAPALRDLYLKSIRTILFGLPPVVLLLSATAQPFLSAWAGSEYGRESAIPFYILIAGTFFFAVSYVPHSLLTARGNTLLLARYHVMELGPFLAGAAALVLYFGAIGAAIAWSSRVIVHSWLLVRAARRHTEVGPVHTGRLWRYYSVALLLLFTPPIAGMAQESAPVLLGVVIVASMLGYCGLVWSRILTGAERLWWWRNVSKVWAVR